MDLRPSYEAVCEELDRRRRIALGFERIEALLERLGDPQRSLRIVQVVGTNGKGTMSVALAAALEEMGKPSGAYLSPHVLSYTERVLVHDAYVSEEEFATAMARAISAADKNSIPATQFELLTAGALLIFREAELSWAVLEAGLGARHDATSVAQAEVVMLTNVSLDHTEYLGDTVEKIAEEKLASLKTGTTLILGTNDPRVVAVARETVKNVGATLIEQKEYRQPASGVYKTGSRESGVGSRIFPYSLLPTPYSPERSDVGFLAAEALLDRTLSDEGRTRAARRIEGLLPARFEVHEVRGVPVVVDGAHNPEGLKAALGAVRAKYGERPLGVVFGALKDKDVASMLDVLEREAHTLVLTRPATDGRSLEPGQLEKEHGPRDAGGREARVMDDAYEALLLAVEEMGALGGVVVVTGSLYTGAAVLGRLRSGG